MNYLAHFYLAFDDPDLLLGQFLGDYVKGSKYNAYSEKIKQGILLHRFIDYSTDSSEQTQSIRDILRPELGRYSGIALDVYFDHFLAINWNRFHKSSLETFASRVYSQLTSRQEFLDEKMIFLLENMEKYNWLIRYREPEGIEKTLREMSRRMPSNNTLVRASEMFEGVYDKLREAFLVFFPQIIHDSKVKLDTFASHRPNPNRV